MLPRIRLSVFEFWGVEQTRNDTKQVVSRLLSAHRSLYRLLFKPLKSLYRIEARKRLLGGTQSIDGRAGDHTAALAVPDGSAAYFMAAAGGMRIFSNPPLPPFPEGLPATPVEAVVASQSELIEHIRGVLGYTPGEFDRWVSPILYRYAAFVHVLPASAHHHHRGAGGLWRHSLEVALSAAQGSE